MTADTYDALNEIAERLTKDTCIQFSIIYDHGDYNVYHLKWYYIQFGYFGSPDAEAPAGAWGLMENGYPIDFPHADLGKYQRTSNFTQLPDDLDEAETVIETALNEFKAYLAERGKEDADELIAKITADLFDARETYWSVLAECRAEVNKDGQRIYSDEEAEIEAARCARIYTGQRIDPDAECYLDDFEDPPVLAAMDLDPRDSPLPWDCWGELTVKIPFDLPTLSAPQE